MEAAARDDVRKMKAALVVQCQEAEAAEREVQRQVVMERDRQYRAAVDQRADALKQDEIVRIKRDERGRRLRRQSKIVEREAYEQWKLKAMPNYNEVALTPESDWSFDRRPPSFSRLDGRGNWPNQMSERSRPSPPLTPGELKVRRMERDRSRDTVARARGPRALVIK